MSPFAKGLVSSDQQNKVSKGWIEEQKHHQISQKDDIEVDASEKTHFLEISTEHLSKNQTAKRIGAKDSGSKYIIEIIYLIVFPNAKT